MPHPMIDLSELKPAYNERREKWYIQYINPGSTQVQAMYDKDGVLLEFDTEFDALEWLFNYHAAHTPGADDYGPVDHQKAAATPGRLD